jgi:transcriptional regulator NrdR family protein
MVKYKCPYCNSEDCLVNNSSTVLVNDCNNIRVDASCLNCRRNYIVNLKEKVKTIINTNNLKDKKE